MKSTVWPLLVLQPPLGTVPQFAIVIPAPDCALLYGNIKATQPQLQPALLRLSAIISQYFKRTMFDNYREMCREAQARWRFGAEQKAASR